MTVLMACAGRLARRRVRDICGAQPITSERTLVDYDNTLIIPRKTRDTHVECERYIVENLEKNHVATKNNGIQFRLDYIYKYIHILIYIYVVDIPDNTRKTYHIHSEHEKQMIEHLKMGHVETKNNGIP